MTDIVERNFEGYTRRLKDMGDNTHAPIVVTDDVSYAEIIDTTTSATYAYHCEAVPGTATSDAAWRISRLTVATGVVLWADGNANFDNVADNRATTAVYS